MNHRLLQYLGVVVPLALAGCDTGTLSEPDGFAAHVRADDDAPPSRVIAFGDSYSDLGNLSLATGGFLAPPPYFDGRFSNGPLWLDELVAQLGLPPIVASLTGGTSFAWGGAETGSGIVLGFIPNVGMQIDQFFSQDALSGDELLVVWAGGNDGLNNVTGGPSGSEPESAVTNISDHVSDLAAAGGRHFLVPNFLLLGLTPFFAGTPEADAANAWSEDFNDLLEDELERLEDVLDISVFHLDVSELIEEIIDDPEDFGLTNVLDRACGGCEVAIVGPGGPALVENPDEYLWWDLVHVTRVVHRLIGAAAAELVLDGDDDDDDDDNDDDDDDDDDGNG